MCSSHPTNHRSSPTCNNLPLVSENEGPLLFSQASPYFNVHVRDPAQSIPSLTYMFIPPFLISLAHRHAQIFPYLNSLLTLNLISHLIVKLQELFAFIIYSSSLPIDFSQFKLLSALIDLPKQLSIRSRVTSIYLFILLTTPSLLPLCPLLASHCNSQVGEKQACS